MKTLRNKNKAGFTLIELLVVIAIIGLLASVVLLALNSARAKSRDAKRLADIRQIASALELYFNDNSGYATGTAGVLSATSAVGLAPKYIGLYPTAPTPQDGSCAAASTDLLGNLGNQYFYSAGTGSGATYTLGFCLGAQTGGYGPGPHDLTPAGIQ